MTEWLSFVFIYSPDNGRVIYVQWTCSADNINDLDHTVNKTSQQEC